MEGGNVFRLFSQSKKARKGGKRNKEYLGRMENDKFKHIQINDSLNINGLNVQSKGNDYQTEKRYKIQLYSVYKDTTRT